jgi:hypothetical protein
VATLVAGSRFGHLLLWAAVLGCVLKIILVESVGCWYLASGQTLFQGWRSLGRWTTVYFGIYVVIFSVAQPFPRSPFSSLICEFNVQKS